MAQAATEHHVLLERISFKGSLDSVRQSSHAMVLDRFRLDDDFVVAADGTGVLSFRECHYEHCLEHRNQSAVYYLHSVLEVKMVHPCGLALFMTTEFIANPLPQNKSPAPAALTDYEVVKQDCELKAFLRMLENVPNLFVIISQETDHEMFAQKSPLGNLAGIFHGLWCILQDGNEFEPICRLNGKPRLA
jgi:hypothetical protein